MQAFEIAYADDERRMVMGWPSGMVRVHDVNVDDGSPGPIVAEVVHHRTCIVFARIIKDTVVTVSEDGRWAVSEAASGTVLRSGQVDGESVAADVDASGASLFLFAHDGDACVYRVDLATGAISEGPDVDDALSVRSRVFALDERRAAFHVCSDDWETETVHDSLVFVDFSNESVEIKHFANAPASDFNDDRFVMDIDVSSRRGIRKHYGRLSLHEDDGETSFALELEVFGLDDLQPIKTIPVAFLMAQALDEDHVALFKDSDVTDEDYRETRDDKLDHITAMRLVGHTAWVGFRGGAVRRIDLENDARSVWIHHGGTPKEGAFTLNDVFARNMINAYTLGVSPSGKLVGFSNPNDFFNSDTLGLETAAEPIKLPLRYDGTNTIETPVFCALTEDGGRLVAAAASEDLFVIDTATGEVTHQQHIEFPYGQITGVSQSPDGKWLALSVEGGDFCLWDLEQDEIGTVGIPPHTVMTAFIGARQVVAGHSHGAVVLVDVDQVASKLGQVDVDGYFDEDDEDQEESEPMYVSVRSRVGEDDDLDEFDEDDFDADNDDDLDDDEDDFDDEDDLDDEDDDFDDDDDFDNEDDFDDDDEDDLEALMGSWEDFEQGQSDFFLFAVGRVGEHHLVAACDDGGDVRIYIATTDGIRVGPAIEGEFGVESRKLRTIAFCDELLVGPVGDQLVGVEPLSGQVSEPFECDGVTRLFSHSKGLFGFRDDRGELVRIDPRKRTVEVVFTYSGPAVGPMSVGGDWVSYIEADGTVVLASLDTGKTDKRWVMRPGKDARHIERADH